MKIRSVCILVLVVLIVSCSPINNTQEAATQATTAQPSPTQAAQATPLGGGTGDFAFIANANGQWDIYLMHTDGHGFVNLTNDGNEEDAFRWSPDGKRIVYRTVLGGNGRRGDPYQNWIINADGSGKSLLLDCPSSCGLADWSTDGQSLALQVFSAATNSDEIDIINPDGTSLQSIVNGIGYIDNGPKWSPNGQAIGFAFREENSTTDLAMIDINGNLTRLTETPDQNEYFMSWSPDGSKMLFEILKDNFSFAVMDLSTRLITLLPLPDNFNFGGSKWLPNGSIAGINSNTLFSILPDGSGYTEIHNFPWEVGRSSISPDGTMLIAGKSTPDPNNNSLFVTRELFLYRLNDDLTLVLDANLFPELITVEDIKWQP